MNKSELQFFGLQKYESGNSYVTHTESFALQEINRLRVRLLQLMAEEDAQLELHTHPHNVYVIPLEGNVHVTGPDGTENISRKNNGVFIPEGASHRLSTRSKGLVAIVDAMRDRIEDATKVRFAKGTWKFAPSRSNSQMSSPLNIDIDPEGAHFDCTQVNIWHSYEEPMHWHASDVYGFIYQGYGSIVTPNDERTKLKRGDTLMIPHGMWHVQNARRHHNLNSFNVEVSSDKTDFQTNRYYHPPAE